MALTLHDITKWYKNQGLVGEETTALLQTLVAVSGKPIGFGIESVSGGGKSATMDLLTGHKSKDNGLIEEKYIYFKDAGSSTALYYDADKVNRAKMIVFAELQKDRSDNTTEAIKSMTEGKRAQRNVTDVTTQEVREQNIEPKTVLYTLAIENDTKPDPELRRRCIVINTDISKTQTRKVLDMKGRQYWDSDAARCLTDEEAEAIRKNVNTFLNYNFDIKNPFAQQFASQVAEISPDQKARSVIGHFFNVASAVTKMNMMSRIVIGDQVLANIQDLYMTLDIYQDSFLRDLFSIPPIGDVVLHGFMDAEYVEATLTESTVKAETKGNKSLGQYGADMKGIGSWFDINHIRKAIKERQNVTLAKNIVTTICRQLVDAGYLEEDRETKVIKYQVVEQMKTLLRPDWASMVDTASVLVKEKYPQKYEQWLEMQSKPYIHPITGEWVEVVPSPIDELDEDLY